MLRLLLVGIFMFPCLIFSMYGARPDRFVGAGVGLLGGFCERRDETFGYLKTQFLGVEVVRGVVDMKDSFEEKVGPSLSHMKTLILYNTLSEDRASSASERFGALGFRVFKLLKDRSMLPARVFVIAQTGESSYLVKRFVFEAERFRLFEEACDISEDKWPLRFSVEIRPFQKLYKKIWVEAADERVLLPSVGAVVRWIRGQLSGDLFVELSA